jgi:diguanylate cyclase (GGDEF)-like protein/PAS domain S-box-containing protein
LDKPEETRSLQWSSRVLAILVAVFGTAIVIARVPLFEVVPPRTLPSLMGGVALALCGSSLLALSQGATRPAALATHRQLAYGLAVAALTLAIGTLAYYLTGPPPANANSTVVMPPNTALAVLFLSSAIVVLVVEERLTTVAQCLALASIGMCILALIGHAYGERRFTGIGSSSAMTLPVAGLLALGGLSVLFARPNAGLMRVVVSPLSGGLLLRRLFLPVILAPVALIWLLYQSGVLDTSGRQFGLALASLAMSALLAVLLWSQALALDRHERTRGQYEKELAAAQMAHLVVQSAVDYAIFQLDPQGRVRSWNAGAERIKGYQAVEIIGQPYERFFTPEDVRAGLPQRLLEEARSTRHATSEGWRVRRDGSYFYAQVALTTLYDEFGELLGFSKLTQDITERKRAADEARVLRSMVDTVVDPIIVIDEHGVVETFNPAASRVFGFSPEEIVGRNISMLMPSPYREEHDLYLQRYLRTGAPQIIGRGREIVAQRKDGSLFPVELAVSEMMVENQRKFTGVVRDITQRRHTEEALRTSEQRLKLALESGKLGVWEIDTEGQQVTVNENLCALLDYAPGEIGPDLAEWENLTHPQWQAAVRAQLDRLVHGEVDLYSIEFPMHTKGGQWRWMLSRARSAGRGKDGRAVRVVGVQVDIDELKQAGEAIRRSQLELELALQGGDIHLWRVDWRSGQAHFQDRLAISLGYQPDRVPHDLAFWSSLVHPDDLARLQQLIQRHRTAEMPRVDAEVRLRTAQGQWRWMLTRAKVVEADAEGHPLVTAGTHLDITERKESEERVLHMAQHDPLTGLANRKLTYEFCERLLASARRNGTPAALLFIDLDRFKPINDLYGHEAGDAVLGEVALRLVSAVRSEDVVGRLGGDEFLVALANVGDGRDAARAAAHCIASLNRPVRYQCTDLQVSPSIGISLFPQDGEDVESLIKNADAAMYHAKENGRNGFQFYTEELNRRAALALGMENRLRGGLGRHEFILHYQPIVDAGSLQVVGAEALLRWPGSGIGPNQFIPIAESSGFIQELGEWVLQEACRQQRLWLDHGVGPLKVSVNVSPAQFRSQSFRSTVAKAVVESGIDPHWLQLEITENVLMKGGVDVIAALKALKELGLRIVLDDFGKGYSSLSYLQYLPIDAVKVDQDFVKNMDTDPTSEAITETIIRLGNSLGMDVVAEGIESQDILERLRRKNCRQMQGYHVCRPVAANDFEDWYRSRAAA